MSAVAWLAIPCFTPALTLVARNPVGIPHLERLIAVSLLAWVLGSVLMVAGLRVGLPESVATAIVSLLIVAFFWGGELMRVVGSTKAILAMSSALLIVVVLLVREKSDWVPNAVIAAISVGLLTGLISQSVESVRQRGDDSITDATSLQISMKERPDVFLVIFDGFPGLQAIELDEGRSERRHLETELKESGMTVPRSVWASYWTTQLSIPSLLNMDYPTRHFVSNDASLDTLYDMVGGSNRLVDLLQSNGYETIMVESGWSGSSCGPEFDHCVASRWFDDSLFLLLSKTILKDWVLSEFGYSFTAGSRFTMAWLKGNSDELVADHEPTFVFAHVMAPHPPFFIDDNCGLSVTNARSGVTFQRSGVSEADRSHYLAEQMGCLKHFMVEFRRQIGDEAILIFVSDHGTDRRDQLRRDPTRWGLVDHIERNNVLLAVSGPVCEVGEAVVLPNLMRRALSCLTSRPIADVPELIFTSSDTTMSSSQLQGLMGRD